MTIPSIPLLPEIAYILGACAHGIVSLLNYFVPIYPSIYITDKGSDWRVVKKFLFIPLVRLDKQGYDWMDYRPVYQSHVMDSWIDMWVITDSLGR